MHNLLQPPASLHHQDDSTSQTVEYPRPVFTSLTSRPRRCQPVRHSFSQWMTCEVCRGLRLIILRWWSNQMMTRLRGRCHAHIIHLNSLWLSLLINCCALIIEP